MVVVDAKLQWDMRRSNGDPEKVALKLLCNRATPLAKARAVSQKRREDAQAARDKLATDRAAQPEPVRRRWVHIELQLEEMAKGTLERLADTLRQSPGSQPVALEFVGPRGRRVVSLGEALQVHGGPELAAATRALPAVTAVWEADPPANGN